MFKSEQVDKLKEKLKASDTFQRAKGGMTLTYIEGWHAIAEANEIFGHGGWMRETLSMTVTDDHVRKVKRTNKNTGREEEVDQHIVSYLARVRVTVWAGEREVIREGYGSGTGYDQSLGAAHESAVKEAETDAMKRALMTFGWRFGLALYDKTRKHVSGDPVKSEGVSGEKDSQLGQKDGKLIEEFKRLAVLVGEQEGNPEYAYVEFLSYPRDGKTLHLGPKSLDAWSLPLSDKRRKWLAGAIDKLLLKFPELEINADDIQF